MRNPNGLGFSETQRYALERLSSGPRAYGSDDGTYLILERKGFIRRLGGPKRDRLRSSLVIEWEITETGTAKLAEG